MSWLTVVSGVAGLIISILTYLNVTRKETTKMGMFQAEIPVAAHLSTFTVKGEGALEHFSLFCSTIPFFGDIELSVYVDDNLSWNDTLGNMRKRASKYITRLDPTSGVAIECSLNVKFTKKLSLDVHNKESSVIYVEGKYVYSVKTDC